MTVENPIVPLTDDQCWGLLAKAEVGRLATALERRPEIFPMNYVVDGETIVFRTAEGSKLLELTANEQVAFEVDDWNEESGTSVVVHGRAAVIEDSEELARVERLPLLPWVPTVKLHYVRITAQEVTGRKFFFGEEPERSYT